MAKIKAKAKKLTNKELQDTQLMVQNINKIQLQIGDLEVQKSFLMSTIFQAKNEFAAFQKELQEKYGDVIVNINNGSLKPKENEQVNTKN